MGDRRGTVFFDYDGTLHDTMALYGPAFRAACAWLSKEGWLERRTYADADIACWLGWTTEEMWTTFAPHLPEPVWREASLRVRDEMERLRKEGRARLFPGVEEALDEVASRGATMVLLSNCWRSYGEDHMREFGLGRWIEGLHCAQDFDWIPKWQIYREVASFYPLPHIMVGGPIPRSRGGPAQRHSLRGLRLRIWRARGVRRRRRHRRMRGRASQANRTKARRV